MDTMEGFSGEREDTQEAVEGEEFDCPSVGESAKGETHQ
jgi:hypothetical protein